MDTVHIEIELPVNVLSPTGQNPDHFVQEMRIAAAIKWYEMALISQDKAATIAGLSRTEFISALNRFGVTPFQIEADELIQEVERGSKMDT